MSYNWEPGETITLFNGQKFKRVDSNEAGGLCKVNEKAIAFHLSITLYDYPNQK